MINNDLLAADLTVLEKRRAGLQADLQVAVIAARALEDGNPAATMALPAFARHYFPDAASKNINDLADASTDAWARFYWQQIWYDLDQLQLQMQKPVARLLCMNFANAAGWSKEEASGHKLVVTALKETCLDRIATLKEGGFVGTNIDKLERRLEDVLIEDHTHLLDKVTSTPHFIAFQDKRLRTMFRAMSENAGSILEASRNDMAETWLVFNRRAGRVRKTTLSRLLDRLRDQGQRSLHQLDRANDLYDLTGVVLRDLENHTKWSEPRIGALTPPTAFRYH